ncbi:MAG: hypothetical protein HYS34_07355 [Acidobacteria bacterium]|nr:hypothetical protein [Acidobacteriota bacterium]
MKASPRPLATCGPGPGRFQRRLAIHLPIPARWRYAALAVTLLIALPIGWIDSLAGGRASSSSPAPRPVILIPGLLGSILEQEDTGRRVWGSYFQMRFVSPHRGLVDPAYDGLELPTASTTLRENRDGLVPGGLLEHMVLIPHVLSMRAYWSWVKFFTRRGYVQGDIRQPRKGDTCFVFDYDWRRDLVESAQALAERIEAIRSAYGDPDLKVDLVAHSMGGLIVRYYLLYGASDVLGGHAPPVPTMAGATRVAHAVFLATPNEGSMLGFLSMLHGTRIGFRKISPLVLFTMPSCFEVLPSPGNPVFLRPDGTPIRLDLYDPGTWVTNRWSIYGPELRENFHQECLRIYPQAGESAFLAKYEEWGRYLKAVLDRARRFHEAIAQDKSAAPPVPYHLFGGDCQSTLKGVLIDPSQDGGRTESRPSQRPEGMSRTEFRALVEAPGDGTVTRESLLGRALSDRSGLPAFSGASAAWACVGHDKIQRDSLVQIQLLEILRSAD